MEQTTSIRTAGAIISATESPSWVLMCPVDLAGADAFMKNSPLLFVIRCRGGQSGDPLKKCPPARGTRAGGHRFPLGTEGLVHEPFSGIHGAAAVPGPGLRVALFGRIG